MSDTVLLVAIMTIGSVGVVALFLGLARVSYLLKRNEQLQREKNETDDRTGQAGGDATPVDGDEKT